MAEISKIKLPNQQTYTLKDETARTAASNAQNAVSSKSSTILKTWTSVDV